MSVKPNHIDFDAVTKEAAKKVLPNTKVDNAENKKIDFAAVTEEALKKKEPSQSVTTPPVSPIGAANRTYEFSLPFGDPTKIKEQTPEQKEEANYKGFKETDKVELNSLLQKHNVLENPLASIRSNLGMPAVPDITPQKSLRPFAKEYNDLVLLESQLGNKLVEERKKYEDRDIDISEANQIEKGSDLYKDLQNVKNLKRKIARELVIEGTDEVKAVVGTDQSGNNLNKLLNRLGQANAITAPLAAANISLEVQDEIKKLPTQFTTGLRYIEKAEPVEYARVLDALKNGNRLSATQVAAITNYGIDIEEERLNRDVALAVKNTKPDTDRLTNMKGQMDALKPAIESYEEKVKQLQLSPQEIADYKNKVNEYNTLVKEAKPLQQKLSDAMGGYAAKAEALSKTKLNNLLNNEEVLRAFLSEGIAERGDEIGKATQAGNVVSPQAQVAGFMFGHTWNYSDDEIKNYGERTAKENGLDPASPQVQKAIKYLQDNEGIMVMQNSIAKAGGIREFFKGAAEPIRGISNTLEDLGKESYKVYAEGKSQGNVNVSEKRLKAEDTGVRGVLNEVLKGTGQFATQAGLMYATGAGIGGVARGILGRAGTAALQGDIALADMGLKDIVGKALLKGQNPIATFTTSYAMAYDSNLKNALNYTSDNSLAKKVAAFNSGLEGATELFLSPLDIATGIAKKFTKGQTQDLLKILSDKSLKSDPSKLKEYATKFVKGVLGTAKVAGAEIGEEIVTQIADYATNAYLNPDSESFQNRDLQKELMHTAYQTGLTMAIPALLNGIGSAKANTFSKGSLMIAAQNRQQMIDSYKKSFEAGSIDQNQLNANISLINTAAQANAELPKKADGTVLNTNEKADYIFSRVTEAMLQNKANRVKDAAEKQILNKQIIQQQNYRAAILGNEKIAEEPSYKVDGNEVSKADFIRIAKSENSNDYNFEVEGDEETQIFLRSIGGVDTETEGKPAAQQKNEDIELLQTLKGKPTVFEFEFNAMVANPEIALREIADQALGFTRNEGQRVPHEFGAQEKQAREKYGDAVVDRAIELYPDEKTAAKNETREDKIQRLEKELESITDDNNPRITEIDAELSALEKEAAIPPKKESVPVSETTSTGLSRGDEPSAEQQLTDIQDGNVVTFEYKNESEVPEVFKDKISSKGEINGKPYVKVTMAKSLADFHLQDQSLSSNTPSKEQVKNETTKEPIKADEPISTEKISEPESTTNKEGGKAKGKLAKFKEKRLAKPAESSKEISTPASEKLTKDVGSTKFSIDSIVDKVVNKKEKLSEEEKQFVEDNKSEVSIAVGKAVMAKNKPKAEKTEQPKTNDDNSPQGLLRKYNEDTNYNIYDLVNDIEIVANESGDTNLKDAVAKYREEQAYDNETKGRNDMTAAEDNFINQIQQSIITEPVLTEEERQQRIQSLTEEKQQKVNEVTKPEITFDTGLSLTDLAGTSEANRQLHDDYKSQLASLKNIVNCLWQ